MPRHMSNSDRIARLAAEAEATAREKEEKKKVKAAAPPRKSSGRAPKAPVRLKIVWTVGMPAGQPVKTYPYAEKASADAEAERLGRGHVVRALKVPMED